MQMLRIFIIMKRFLPSRESSAQMMRSSFWTRLSSFPNSRLLQFFVPLNVVYSTKDRNNLAVQKTLDVSRFLPLGYNPE